MTKNERVPPSKTGGKSSIAVPIHYPMDDATILKLLEIRMMMAGQSELKFLLERITQIQYDALDRRHTRQ